MAVHWDTFELQVRDDINEPNEDSGGVTTAKLARWANEALTELPMDVQLSKARIVIAIGNGVAVIAEEDWPGTETVGIVNYTFGKDGTFYIKYAELIDAIYPLIDMGEEDDCGVYVADWTRRDYQLPKVRQDDIVGYVGSGSTPEVYSVYRFFVYVEQDPADNPRPLVEPYEALGVWLYPQFDPAELDECDAPVYRYYEIQYRRRPPELDLTELEDECGIAYYTQPYFYVPEIAMRFVREYVEMQALYSIADKRWSAAAQKLRKTQQRIKRMLANRGDVDEPWRLENPDLTFRATTWEGGFGSTLWQDS